MFFDASMKFEYRDQILELKKKYSWPETKPLYPFDPHGWFGWCHKSIMDVVLPKDATLIIELGSWLGKSTRFILDSVPSTYVLAIDHWRGDESIINDADIETKNKINNLYERFISNCWDYRERLIPIKSSTIDGLKEISSLKIIPSFIYLDAAHSYDDAKNDLKTIHDLYPNTRLAGDDYGGKWHGLKKAVDEYCQYSGNIVCNVEHAWTISRKEEEDSIKESLKIAQTFRKQQMYTEAMMTKK